MKPNHELQSLALNDARHEAFQAVCDLATKVLTEEDPEAFERILRAFNEYKVHEHADIDYLIKHEKEHNLTVYLIGALKSGTDVYWRLPEPIKQLWDDVPELRKWRGR
jgi:hypothetical protein